ncbi:shikimate dehydrogenase [Nocardioides terrisoli]|uniref:shikimate dehydrogenase n=1 Tax=Nocardioides terrisoli TaxID=3388267 RepID=UPI00287B85BF|nr:shikimate dehydrogenase [Nocardioides marmorisolisilvae]
MTRCAVLGSPIAHSLSPALHRAAYAELGLDWTYDAIEVDEASLPDFLDGLDSTWRGLSLTMPLKRSVVPLLDRYDPIVDRTGVANTVLVEEGHLAGRNTDVPGAVAALREGLGSSPVGDATVLGGGATATSMIFALADLGCREVRLLVRSRARAQDAVEAVARHPQAPRVLVEEFHAVPATDVLVSTIPAGAQTPDLVAGLHAAVVFDVVYDPWPTPLAAAALADGARLVSGLDLLVHQAVDQVALMTRTPRAEVPVGAMRAAGEAALTGRRA